MKVLQFLIDTTGAFIWPLTQQDASSSSASPPEFTTILFKFYNGIQTTTNPLTGAVTNIVPITPVISGMAGTITVQARPSPDSPWLNITNGTLDLSMNGIMVQTKGLITGIKATPDSCTGFNYILCELNRGA